MGFTIISTIYKVRLMKKMCECRDGCACEHNPGPALYQVRRGEKAMNVCSKCTGAYGEEQIALLTDNISPQEQLAYDALGLIALIANTFSDDQEEEEEPTLH